MDEVILIKEDGPTLSEVHGLSTRSEKFAAEQLFKTSWRAWPRVSSTVFGNVKKFVGSIVFNPLNSFNVVLNISVNQRVGNRLTIMDMEQPWSTQNISLILLATNYGSFGLTQKLPQPATYICSIISHVVSRVRARRLRPSMIPIIDS